MAPEDDGVLAGLGVERGGFLHAEVLLLLLLQCDVGHTRLAFDGGESETHKSWVGC
jgi:hypothetical protein